jgi:histidinol-phosphate aminotransferase
MNDTTDRINRWIRPEIRALSAYHVPPAAGMIKLDAMENPYRWPETVVDEWLETLRAVELNRYPDPAAGAVRDGLRRVMAVPDGYEILLGNGSDELIQMLVMAIAAPGNTVLSVEPGFVMYRMISTFVGVRYVGVPLRAADFELDRETLLAAITEHQPALVFLAYPNNPTGNLFDRDILGSVIEAAPGLVVIDEAYLPFAGADCMDLLDRYEHVLVLRTVSKLGLAGLRLGLLIGRPAWLTELDKLRLPYNINVMTQASAVFACRHWQLLTVQTMRIRVDRENLTRQLTGMAGLSVYPSHANFILFRTPAGRADAVFDALRRAGVLIKNLSHAGGLLADCLRVTVGTRDENAAFLSALRAALQDR